jgi:uncharacterized protein (UPF0332 family)
MPFDWINFLRLAEELATRTDEASKRTAISRAYYFVFHLAFSRAESTAGPFQVGESSHRWCWDKYQSTYVKTRDKMCNQLWLAGDRIRRRRIKADYKEEIPRLQDEVTWTLEEAQQFLVNLAALDARYPLP